MLLLCILLLSILGYCLFLFQRFHLEMEETPVLVVATIVFLLYIVALANFLVVGVYAIIGSGLALLAVTAFISRRTLKKLVFAILSPGMIIFILGIPVLYLLSRHIIFYYWDEFSHWGLIVKAMDITGALPTQDSRLLFPTYPPGTALFQYFAGRLLGQTEGIAVFAMMLMVWSAAIAFTKALDWKRFLLVILALLMAYVGYIHFSYPLWCIYVDGILGLLAGSAFALYYQTKNRVPLDILKTIPVLALITLIKESGIIFSILFCLLMLLDQVYLSKATHDDIAKNGGFLRRHPYAVALSLAVSIPVTVYGSWSIHLAAAGITASQSATTANTGIPAAFARALLSEPIGLTKQGLESFGSAVFMIGVLAVSIALFFIFLRDKRLAKRIAIIAGALLAGLVLYSLGLIILYTYKFDENEGTHLASYGRYMGTFFLFLFLCVFAVLLDQIRDRGLKIVWKALPFALSLAFLFLLYMITPNWYMDFRVRKTSDAVRSEIALSSAVIRSVVKPSERVYIIWEDTNGREYDIARYELYPVKINTSGWSIGAPYGSRDVWTKDITAQQWADQLKSYRYVYIGRADTKFASRYGSLFASNQIEDNTIYTVTAGRGDAVVLVKLTPVQ